MSYIGNTPTTQAFTPALDYFSGDGSTTAFTLSRQVASVAQVQAVIENVPQSPGTAFTVSGNVITFTSAPPSGTNNIYVYYTSPITQVIAPGQGTVGTAQLADAAVTGAKIDPTTSVSVNALAVNSNNISATNSLGFRNRIINGDMRIDQRNNGASVSPSASQYTLDRWQAVMTAASAKYSVQKNAGFVTPPAGFSNYLGATSLGAYTVAAGEIMAFQQSIEGFNISDLAWGAAGAQSITLSFWVRSSLTGTFGGALRNSGGTRSYPFTYAISAANTWEQKTVTVAGDTTGTWLTTNGTGILLNFGLGAGATYSGTAGAWAAGNFVTATGATSVVGTIGATFYITGVQLEAGTVATPFERRPYGTELQLAQRYYYKIFPQGTNSLLGVGYTASTTTASVAGSFPVTMRIAPTALEQSGTASNYRIASAAGTANCSSVPTYSSPTNQYGFVVIFTVASGLTSGFGMQGRTGDTTGANGYLAWSAEL